MLGEQGTEQFHVTTWLDDKKIGDQAIHDPFIRNKTVIGISRWDLFKALFKRQFELKIRVHLDATEGAMQAILTLDPVELQNLTKCILAARAAPREHYDLMGLSTDGVMVNNAN